MKEKNYKKSLTTLTENVVIFLAVLDKIMKEPSSYERGKKIAKASNWLNLQNDKTMHFDLDYGFRKIGNLKNKHNVLPSMNRSMKKGK